MKNQTGWDAVFSIKKYQQNPETGVQPLIPKHVLVKHGVWEEWVEFILAFGCNESETRECFKEYGCSEKEIKGYFAQYEQSEPLTMAASA